MLYGTGITTKNVVAMSYGLPVVTTTSGNISLRTTPGVDVLVADTAMGIADLAVQLYKDPDIWERLSTGGAKNVAKNFCQENVLRGVELMVEISKSLIPRTRCEIPWSARSIDDSIVNHDKPFWSGKDEVERIRSYVAKGEELVDNGNFSSAIAQFRHACSFSVQSWKASGSYERLLRGLQECYQRVGDLEGLNRCVEEISQSSTIFTRGNSTVM
jgi:hypothetical protein